MENSHKQKLYWILIKVRIRIESVTFTLTDNGRQAAIFLHIFRRLPQCIHIYVIRLCVRSCSVHVIHQSMRSFSHAHSRLAFCVYVFLGFESTFQRLYMKFREFYMLSSPQVAQLAAHTFIFIVFFLFLVNVSLV